MNYKKTVYMLIFLIIVLAVMLVGRLAGLWQFGINPWSLIGLAAVVPALVWIFTKGINFVNSPVYFAGLAFIIYKNFFNSFAWGFVIVCGVLALAALILPLTSRKNFRSVAEN